MNAIESRPTYEEVSAALRYVMVPVHHEALPMVWPCLDYEIQQGSGMAKAHAVLMIVRHVISGKVIPEPLRRLTIDVMEHGFKNSKGGRPTTRDRDRQIFLHVQLLVRENPRLSIRAACMKLCKARGEEQRFSTYRSAYSRLKKSPPCVIFPGEWGILHQTWRRKPASKYSMFFGESKANESQDWPLAVVLGDIESR